MSQIPLTHLLFSILSATHEFFVRIVHCRKIPNIHPKLSMSAHRSNFVRFGEKYTSMLSRLSLELTSAFPSQRFATTKVANCPRPRQIFLRTLPILSTVATLFLIQPTESHWPNLSFVENFFLCTTRPPLKRSKSIFYVQALFLHFPAEWNRKAILEPIAVLCRCQFAPAVEMTNADFHFPSQKIFLLLPQSKPLRRLLCRI